MHVNLLGTRIFADVIKGLKVRSSWSRVGPKSSTCSYEREDMGDPVGKIHREEVGKDECDASAS